MLTADEVGVAIPQPLEVALLATISLPGAATHRNVALWFRGTDRMIPAPAPLEVGNELPTRVLAIVSDASKVWPVTADPAVAAPVLLFTVHRNALSAGDAEEPNIKS